ncbi:MAG: TolC family protein, partial [Planctomycetota bacterium]
DARVALNQPLLRGFGSDASEVQIRVATAQFGQALVDQKLQVINTLAAVDQAYWLLSATRAAVNVRVQQVKLADDQLQRAQRMLRAGEMPETEVVRAESGKADAEELLLQTRNLARERERALKVLVNAPGLEVGGASRIDPTTQALPLRYATDADELTALAMGSRMELLEADLRIAEQHALLLAARREALPQLDFRYQYNINGLGPDFDDSVEVASNFNFQDHTFGLTASYPLGNRERRARLRAANLRKMRELATLESRQLQITQEVHDAVDALETAWQAILANRRRVDLATRLLEAETRQFEQGLRTSTEVLEAQSNLAAAELSLIEALADYEVGRTNLATATGTVLGKAGVQLNVPDDLPGDRAVSQAQ